MEINIEINPSILVHRTFNLKLEHNRFRKFGIYLEVKKKNIDIFFRTIKKKKSNAFVRRGFRWKIVDNMYRCLNRRSRSKRTAQHAVITVISVFTEATYTMFCTHKHTIHVYRLRGGAK